MKEINKPELPVKTLGMAMLNAQSRKNYGGKYKALGAVLPCYTKKQIRSLYPGNNFKMAAEYAPGSKENEAGVLRHESTNLPLTEYGSNTRIKYREKGFVAVDPGEDRYAAILQNVLPQRIAALVLCLAIIAGGIALAVSLNKGGATAAVTSTPLLPALESGAVDWEGVKTTETSGIPADGIRIPGYKSITIEADTTEVSVNLQNPEKNSCYFVIRLVLLDTGETLYESKMIEPGKGLYNITLSRALEAGTYGAQLQYEPYDMTALTRLNGAVVNLDLIVE